MIRNVLKPDGTVHIEQQVANMRYDLTTGQVETVVPGAGCGSGVGGGTASEGSGMPIRVPLLLLPI